MPDMPTFYETSRPIAMGMEGVLQAPPVKLLDHGFIRAVDYMGNDEAIVQAARVSYGAGTDTPSKDEALIRYLMKHRHTTPFEMCEIKIHAKMPIFVARQWIRHRTASVNEESARYSIMEREFYVPEAENMAVQSTSNKQGRGAVMPPNTANRVRENMRAGADREFDHYEVRMSTYDLSRELARMGLPMSTYTQWYWKTDLHNMFNFLSLRDDPHAQYEIRVYAEALAAMVKAWVPMAHQAYEDYRKNGAHLSAAELEAVRGFAKGSGAAAARARDKMTKREWQAFMKLVGLNDTALNDMDPQK